MHSSDRHKHLLYQLLRQLSRLVVVLSEVKHSFVNPAVAMPQTMT